MNFKNFTLFTAMALLPALAMSVAHAEVPFPDPAMSTAIDRGELRALSGATSMSITLALRLPKLDEAENLLKSLHTLGDPQFHRFLSADEFVARFAPNAADVAKVVTNLATYGLTATRSTAITLSVGGSAAALERAFSVSLHSYEVPAHHNVGGYIFHAPLSAPTIPAEIAALVSAVVGFDNRPHLHPHLRSIGSPLARAPSHSNGNAPGSYTVTDFADFYDVQPLYHAGLSGSGSKIGIMTLANFTPSDVFAYWSALDLHVNPNRLTVDVIDGGPGAPSDDSGSLETTLDVEQSGGIAPGADITVYMAPNTDQGFVDLFADAIDQDWADELSISWGEWEWFYNLENAPVTDPSTGRTVSTLQAVHEVLVRAAIQGQSVFTASSDGGAYEALDDGFGPPNFNTPLSAEYPASDPAITAAGGTTLPSTQILPIPDSSENVAIVIPRERVWGWDWMQPYCDAVGTPDLMTCQQPIYGGNIFPVGSGGGVSVFFRVPFYQDGVAGVQLSRPNQTFIEYLPPPAVSYFVLPAYYPGRNVPDVSFDADPFTGYVVYYTSSVTGFSVQSNWGGTSFVAPQLAGVTALLNQQQRGRIGLLNIPLYQLTQDGLAYGGPRAPLHPIVPGDNWFYHGSNRYNPAVGLGTLDVANFAHFLRGQF
jgi:kumamolisin